ncbi:hypothetical protein GCK72_008484 [Caenorhabditis remanei]|uniref:Uncharacterized protein n=1 Tax=Caenorhabditis remanei TaxID=31234 RepID=A0A6A5GXQ2_CAERE|nr:hypothetical protein GCK72_008484 [Caenorhabditis remanei]KAF1760238.1 hypothetical protein GCK72_008484 [Caenorhabditis remanei]
MLNTLITCLLLVPRLYAEISTPDSTLKAANLEDSSNVTTLPLFDLDEQLSKINNSCLPRTDYKQLSSDFVTGPIANRYNRQLLEKAHRAIGLRELRAVLGFYISVEWTNEYQPSDKDFTDDLTIEKYYEFIESEKRHVSRTSSYFHESQFLSGIEFLDKHLPAVRNVYRRYFEGIRRHPDPRMTSYDLGQMLKKYDVISGRVYHAIRGVVDKQEFDLCSGTELKENDEKGNLQESLSIDQL